MPGSSRFESDRSRPGPALDVDAVLFDLDDTLIDWWGSIFGSLAALTDHDTVERLADYCRAHCWDLDPTGTFIWHRNNWMLWESRRHLWHQALPHLPADHVDGLLHRFESETHIGFFDDTIDTIERLRHHTRVAILTNNHLIEREITRLELDTWFEFAIYPGNDCLKPEPGAFTTALDRLGLPPHRVAYVGDSVKADVLGSHGVGMRPVWFNPWGDHWPHRPDGVTVISSLSQLPELIRPE